MSIDTVLDQLAQEVKASGNDNDLSYFLYHRLRFKKMAESITRRVPIGSTVLDTGSHYLHSAVLLTSLGYRVTCLDVSAFTQLDFVRQRAQHHGLALLTENQLEHLSVLGEMPDQFDLVLFTEIFEHITFNPIAFWQRMVYLIKPKGLIYLTTPNAFTLYAFCRNLYRLLFFKGMGMDIKALFPTVTYGHHWKEYSRSEILYYFKTLHPGFRLSFQHFFYRTEPLSGKVSALPRKLLLRLGNLFGPFKEALEVFVEVDKTQPFSIEPPQY